MTYPKAGELVATIRQLSNPEADVPYVWWKEGDPIPMWWYAYPNQAPPIWWLKQNGIMCSDAMNFPRMVHGLPPIGGTPAWYDWLEANGAIQYDASVPGRMGGIIVNPGVWRGGEGQGHIAMYSTDDGHTIIQSADGAGAYQGVHEEEADFESDDWWTPWLYGLMPDVDYSDVIENAPEPQPALVGKPRWIAIDKDGWHRADGPDWSRGWFEVSQETGLLMPDWRGPNEA